jgi:hypothetical protein
MNEDAFFKDLITAVEQQLDSPQTLYVAKTFERLTTKGLSDDEAKERIAACLGEETDAMYRRKGDFDEKSYRTKLDAIDPNERLTIKKFRPCLSKPLPARPLRAASFSSSPC